MIPAANIGLPVLIAWAVRLITEPLGQLSEIAEASPDMKVDCVQNASEPPILPNVYWFQS